MTSKFHPVTHVIFDMDGLLLDTEPLYTEAINNICGKYGCVFTLEAKRAAMGRVAIEAARSIVKNCGLPITPEQYLLELEEQYPIVFAHVKYMPGVRKLLDYFHENGVPQAIATSSGREGYELKSQDQRQTFQALFEHILTASTDPEVKEGKPHPDTFLVAARRFKNPPTDMKNVLVFEDSPLGVEAGIAAGMQVVWVQDLRFVDPKSTTQTADLIISSLQDFDPKLFGL